MTFKLCKRCILPSTKPDLTFNENGICSACFRFEKRKFVDWNKKEKELSKIVENHKSESNWDCVIPVSGGKDSTFQALYARKLGLNPLLVSSTTCDLSPLGNENINNLKNLGFDHIQFSPKKDIRNKLNRFGLEQVGDISWPEHVAMFTLPVKVAVKFGISLIIWGENSQDEYGAGTEKAAKKNILDRDWLEEYGGLNGLRVNDLPLLLNIKKKDLFPYIYPTLEELNKAKITSIFLGSFIPWNGLNNAILSQAYGLKTYGKSVEGSIVDYENLDNHQNGIHDYFKYLKFGFSRATDILSTLIRREIIDRNTALDLLKRNERECFPSFHLGKSLEDIISPLDLNKDEFIKIADMHTNPEIFSFGIDGEFQKLKDGTPQLSEEFLNIYE